MTDPPPRIFIIVPGVEDLDTVVDLLRTAGVQITGQRREFVVDGLLTANQAAAVWRLAEHVDGGDGSPRLGVRVDGAVDLEAALAVLCPEGFDRQAWPQTAPEDGRYADWWGEQQRRQGAGTFWRPPSPQAAAPAAESVCCGEGGPWAPAGKPLVQGCQLCPRSSTYWRRADAPNG